MISLNSPVFIALNQQNTPEVNRRDDSVDREKKIKIESYPELKKKIILPKPEKEWW